MGSKAPNPKPDEPKPPAPPAPPRVAVAMDTFDQLNAAQAEFYRTATRFLVALEKAMVGVIEDATRSVAERGRM